MTVIQDLLLKGKFKPLMDRSYSLDQAREAFAYVASEKKIGNVILEIAPNSTFNIASNDNSI